MNPSECQSLDSTIVEVELKDGNKTKTYLFDMNKAKHFFKKKSDPIDYYGNSVFTVFGENQNVALYKDDMTETLDSVYNRMKKAKMCSMYWNRKNKTNKLNYVSFNV
jgi:hypothetical protein